METEENFTLRQDTLPNPPGISGRMCTNVKLG
jgi:hypothetical protein